MKIAHFLARRRARFARKSWAYARFLAFVVFATVTMIFFKEDSGIIKLLYESRLWSEKDGNFKNVPVLLGNEVCKCQFENCFKMQCLSFKFRFHDRKKSIPAVMYEIWIICVKRWLPNGTSCRRTLSMLRSPNFDRGCARALPMPVDISNINLINVNE